MIDSEHVDGSVAGGKAATQNRILQSAMALFAERGFDRTSISQIAARSGVSRAAIFWHFGNKATLFEETCRHFLVPFRASLERGLVDLEPKARVLDQLTAYDRFVSENRATLKAFVGWVFSASPEQSSFLRDELLSLHRAYEQSIARVLTELLDDRAEAAQQAKVLVSFLHGNMLLELSSATGREARQQTLQMLVNRAEERARSRRR